MNIYIPVEMCSLTVTEEIDGSLSLHVLRRVHTVFLGTATGSPFYCFHNAIYVWLHVMDIYIKRVHTQLL